MKPGSKSTLHVYMVRLGFILVISFVFAFAFNEVTYRLQKEPTDRAPQVIQLVIPQGTAQRIAAGEPVPDIPAEMVFVVGDVLEVINAILSGGKSSRLHQKLVLEKQLALEVDAENSLLSKDPALFYVYATPLPGKPVGEVEKALDRQFLKSFLL